MYAYENDMGNVHFAREIWFYPGQIKTLIEIINFKF